jgi:hypothetical protein
MLSVFHQLSAQARYEAIHSVSVRMQGLPGSHIMNLASCFGTSENTIRTALAWRPDLPPPGRPGAPQLLQDHHKIYIEARTLCNRTQTNRDLAQELVAFFPDLPKCSEQTVARCRHELGLKFCPRRSSCEMTESSRQRRVAW